MAITPLPPAPSRSDPANFSDEADALLGALDTFVTEANAQAAALELNDTTDASSSSIAIGTGAKTFTVTAAKSFQPGMWLLIADDAAPSTNQMFGSITSYAGTTLVMNITSTLGSGTKAAWTISQSSPGGLTPGGPLGTPSSGTLTSCTGLPTAGLATQVFAAGIGIGGAAADTGGIAFPATAVPSADPNTLDDYEEGTYTITITPTTSGTVTLDSTIDFCSYVKIGSIVHIQGYFVISSISSPVGNLRFLLPFTTVNLGESAGNSVGSVVAANLNFTAAYLGLNISENVLHFDIREIADAGAIDIIEGADLGGTETFSIQATYRAA